MCKCRTGNPLQYSCPENPMDRGTWWATVHGVAKSRTRLSDFTSLHIYITESQKQEFFSKFSNVYLFASFSKCPMEI